MRLRECLALLPVLACLYLNAAMLLLFVSKIQIYILTVLGIKCSVFFATLYDRVGLVALITLTLDIDLTDSRALESDAIVGVSEV